MLEFRLEAGRTHAFLLLESAYEENAHRNSNLLGQMESISSVLGAAGITFEPLKGIYAVQAGWWADPTIRVMRDIDILVPENQAWHAWQLLTEIGYVPVHVRKDPDATQHLPALHLHGAVGSVEIHTALARRRWEHVLPPAHLFSGVIDRDTFAVAHLIANAQLHDEGHLLAKVPLRSLYELATIANGPHRKNIEWGYIEDRFRKATASNALEAYRRLARRLFSCDIPSSRWSPSADARATAAIALSSRPTLASKVEPFAYLPRSLSAHRMSDLYGVDWTWRDRVSHVAGRSRPKKSHLHVSIIKDPGPFGINNHTFLHRLGLDLIDSMTVSVNDYDAQADLVVVFNHLREPVTVNAPENRVIKALHEWHHAPSAADEYSIVYPLAYGPADPRNRFEPLFGPYYVDKPAEFLLNQTQQKQLDRVGFCYSVGSPYRVALSALASVDTLYRDRSTCKWTFGQNHRYWLLTENKVSDAYISEKLSDGILLGCFVFYSGSARASEHFHPDCFRDVTGLSPVEVGAVISEAISSSAYSNARETILAERRRLLLERSFAARCRSIIDEGPAARPRRMLLR